MYHLLVKPLSKVLLKVMISKNNLDSTLQHFEHRLFHPVEAYTRKHRLENSLRLFPSPNASSIYLSMAEKFSLKMLQSRVRTGL